ncbi:MAG TPA: hypothetical protein DIS74_10935 [Bacteroidales bacterium]|nr:hypothetical protein [Bacteroidales bacterium]
MSEKQGKIRTSFRQFKTKKKEKITNRNILIFFKSLFFLFYFTFVFIFERQSTNPVYGLQS